MAIVDPFVPPPREWLKVTPVVNDERPKINISTRSYGGRECMNHIQFSNLTELELKALEAFRNGTSWVRCIDGRIEAISALEQLPPPQPDLECGPFWKVDATEKPVGRESDVRTSQFSGLQIEGLGAGIGDAPFGGSIEKRLRANQELAERCGFVCMRSRRSLEGTYYEYWNLSSLWSAKGPLKEHLREFMTRNSLDSSGCIEEACRVITHVIGIRYGALNSVTQRWALCNPE